MLNNVLDDILNDSNREKKKKEKGKDKREKSRGAMATTETPMGKAVQISVAKKDE